MMTSSAEVIAMAASAELLSFTIKPNSLLWVLGGRSALLHRYFWHIITAPSSLLFFCCFQLFTTDTATELTHHCCTFLSSFQLSTMDTVMELRCHCCTFFSSSLSSSSSPGVCAGWPSSSSFLSCALQGLHGTVLVYSLLFFLSWILLVISSLPLLELQSVHCEVDIGSPLSISTQFPQLHSYVYCHFVFFLLSSSSSCKVHVE